MNCRRMAAPLLLALVAGCLAAPREVETQLTLGPKQVEIDVRLKDVRGVGADDLRQLDTFAMFATWKKDWLDDVPWAPTPTRFEFIADAGRLDVALKGTMARADFDACARGAPDGGPCHTFPLELGKNGYAVKAEVLGLTSLTIDPKAKAAWPADAGRIAYTVKLSGDPDRFILDGPSLLRGHALYTSDPAKAEATLAQIKADEVKRASGEWAVPVCTDIPWCGLRTEALQRDRARLVYRYLFTRQESEAGYGLRAPPPLTVDYLGSTFATQIPKDRLAVLDDLRLRIVYDLALAGFHESGRASAPWERVCRPDVMKKPSLKAWCQKLGVK